MGRGILIPSCYHSPATSGWKRAPGGLCLLGLDSNSHGTQCKRKKNKGQQRDNVNMLPRDSNTYLSLTVAFMTPPSMPLKVFSRSPSSVCVSVASLCMCNTAPAQIRVRPFWYKAEITKYLHASPASRLPTRRHTRMNARCRVFTHIGRHQSHNDGAPLEGKKSLRANC